MKLRTMVLATSLVALAGLTGCEDKPAPKLAPTASALAAPKPKSVGAKLFKINKDSSKVDFMMEAPQEKIRGRVNGATSGNVNVDLTDLTKTTAKLLVDISGLEIYKTNIDASGKAVGEEEKNPLQNKHARTWLEISEDAPEDVRKKNSRVEFVILAVKAANKDVTKMKGDERKVTLDIIGEFLLHGRKTKKEAKLEVLFKFSGDKAELMTVKTVEPFAIGLAEHDVHPRDAFGSLAAKTLEALSDKVAKEAQVSINFSAKMSGDAPKPPAGTPKKGGDAPKKGG